MKQKYLTDSIDYFISGDWGQESATKETPNKIRCIRGADIESVNLQKTNQVPVRYVKDATFNNKTLDVGDIIIEKSGGSPIQSTGRTAYINHRVKSDLENIVCSNFCTAFRVKPEYDPKFIYYYFRNIYNSDIFFQFESQTTGIKNLLLDSALKEIPLADYNLPIQQSIASILSALDDKIVLNNKINKELEDLAKTIYDYWFVQNADEKWERKKIGEIIKNQKNGDW